MVSGVSSRPPWSIAKLRPTIASTTSVDNSARPPARPPWSRYVSARTGPAPPSAPTPPAPAPPPPPAGVREIVGYPATPPLSHTISRVPRRSRGSGVRCARCRRARMRGTGPVGAVLHIRSGSTRSGSAESCGNALKFNTVEILPCAERASLHMGACPLKIDILEKPRNQAENSESSRGEAPLECATPAHDPGRPRPPARDPTAEGRPVRAAGAPRSPRGTPPEARPRTAVPRGEGSLYEKTRA